MKKIVDKTAAIKQWYEVELRMTSNTKRGKFLQAVVDDLRPCAVVSVKELFNKLEIDKIRRLTKKHECFKNAYQIASELQMNGYDVRYVEGRVLAAGILPLEHAWNSLHFQDKDGGERVVYFDATFELANGSDVTNEIYAILKEYDVEQVRKVILKTQVYGEIYWNEKADEFLNKEVV